MVIVTSPLFASYVALVTLNLTLDVIPTLIVNVSVVEVTTPTSMLCIGSVDLGYVWSVA